MANNTISRQKRGITSAIYNSLFSQTESEDVKSLKKNVAILMQNQNEQQSFIEFSAQVNNITCINLAKSTHMINGLVDALRRINNNAQNNSLAISNLNYARNFFLAFVV